MFALGFVKIVKMVREWEFAIVTEPMSQDARWKAVRVSASVTADVCVMVVRRKNAK